MEEKNEQQELNLPLLNASQAVYALLARLWAEPIDQAALTALTSPNWEVVLQLFDEQKSEMGDSSTSLLRTYEDLVATAERLGIECLQSAYNWCFMGLGTKVAPWESVYVTNERLIMQKSTLAVRQAYAAAGFVARNKGSEPDDHIATECDFMAKLAERASEALTADDKATCHSLLSQAQSFLEKHLVVYIQDFAEAFDEAADKARACDEQYAQNAKAFYGVLAQFCATFFELDCAVLCEVDTAVSAQH